jgi:long-subunit acyl-CoA synthetase (AMP-forming)
VPYILQEIVNLPDPHVFDTLKQLKFIASAGVQLPEKLGNLLSENGVRVIQGYGMTECGVAMIGDTRESWKYMRLVPSSGAQMRKMEENVYELVIVNGNGCFNGYINNPSATQVRKIFKLIFCPSGNFFLFNF